MNSDKKELQSSQNDGHTRHVELLHTSLSYFAWPTSKPGPFATPPPPGQKPLRGRTDQMLEIAYNQETGVPSTDDPRKWFPDSSQVGATGFDQRETAQEIERKRRNRQ